MKINKKLTIQVRAKTFYFAFFFFTQKNKKRHRKFYIFCRYLDDIGDEKNIKKKQSIQILMK